MPDSPAPTRSPLHEIHLQAGAHLAPFAAWLLPLYYQGLSEEHLAVRHHCGLFDISHLSQFLVQGPHATLWLNRLLTNNVARLAVGQAQHSLLLTDSGGILDLLLLYRRSPHSYLLVSNASPAILACLQAHPTPGVTLENLSPSRAALAVQGPRSPAVYQLVAGAHAELPDRNGFTEFYSLRGGLCAVARTGYTGEDGFEFFCDAEEAPFWWREFTEHGAQPCGLGARHSLRLEMGYPLSGLDLSPTHSPRQARLQRFVDLAKGPFLGRPALLAQPSPTSLLTGLRLSAASPPPLPSCPVYQGPLLLGTLSSGGFAPSLHANLALAYLPPSAASPGTPLEIDIGGQRYPALTVPTPFYRPPATAS